MLLIYQGMATNKTHALLERDLKQYHFKGLSYFVAFEKKEKVKSNCRIKTEKKKSINISSPKGIFPS